MFTEMQFIQQKKPLSLVMNTEQLIWCFMFLCSVDVVMIFGVILPSFPGAYQRSPGCLSAAGRNSTVHMCHPSRATSINTMAQRWTGTLHKQQIPGEEAVFDSHVCLSVCLAAVS